MTPKQFLLTAITLGPGMFLACWGISELLWRMR